MIKNLGKKSVFSVGIGTWGIGGKSTAVNKNDESEIISIEYAISKGINVIDTAEMYAAGHSEEIVGKAIKKFDREKLFIISKVWPDHLKRDDLIKSARESIKRLDTDYLDLYLIHWPSNSVPLEESLNAMLYLKDNGLTSHIGVSNFGPDLLEKSIEISGKSNILADEIEYNYTNQKEAESTISFCKKHGINIIAYSPLSKGNIPRDECILRIAEKHGVSEAQVVLRFLMEDSLPIPKAVKKAHIDDIVESIKLHLDQNEINELRKA